MNPALNPPPALLAKVGSILVHVEEFFETVDAGDLRAAHFDRNAIEGLLADEEVKSWLKTMQSMCMLPEKRESKKQRIVKDPAPGMFTHEYDQPTDEYGTPTGRKRR